MRTSEFTIGTVVSFCNHVFEPPFFPFYEEYRGHTFKVVGHGNERAGEDPDSLVLQCVTDSSVIVKGNIHKQDVKKAS